ncbi:MAG: gas vesicle protein [Nitrosomonadaceae bacterium]|nr:gas vesicle protein [Nitrosomonadaceae bacterium]
MEFSEQRSSSLCELLDRVLNTGVVATGDIVISVAGVDLIYLNLQLLLTSVETARASQLSVSPSTQTETLQERL